MKKIGKNIYCMTAAILIGGMTALTGCGASEEAAAPMDTAPTEMTVEAVAPQTVEAQTVEPKTTMEEAKEEPETADSETEPVETKAETKPEPELEPAETDLPKENAAANNAAEGAVSDADFAVIVKGVTIPLLGDMRNYAASLGDPDDFGSAKSCTEAGEDKVYTYGQTVLYTYVTNGADVISLIEITGGASLPSGIQIGSTKDEVIATYGSGYTEEGTELIYEMGNKTIGLQMVNDQVSFIELFGQ